MASSRREKLARALENLLMDAMHAMASMNEVEQLGADAKTSASSHSGKSKSRPDDTAADDPSLVDRITELTGTALRFAARSTDTSLRLGRALLASQDQIRLMLATGQSLKDIREVAGLTLNEMSEALNLRDKSLLEAIENGTATLSFDLILRLAALIARNDPIPFVLKYTRQYNPEVWKVLDDWGVGRLPLQFERERQFINIFRGHDDARELTDEGFKQVLDFTRQSFEMSLHFVAEQEQTVARLKDEYQVSKPETPEDPGHKRESGDPDGH